MLLPPTQQGEVELVYKNKQIILDKAFARYQSKTGGELSSAVENFCVPNASSLDDYAFFRSLKRAHEGAAWHEWEPTLAGREAAALAGARETLRHQIE